MTPVKSSQLKAVGYDPKAQKMHIEFPDGSVYEYSNVFPKDHKALMEAKSHGSHFIRNMKNNAQKHPWTKIKDKPEKK